MLTFLRHFLFLVFSNFLSIWRGILVRIVIMLGVDGRECVFNFGEGRGIYHLQSIHAYSGSRSPRVQYYLFLYSG